MKSEKVDILRENTSIQIIYYNFLKLSYIRANF